MAYSVTSHCDHCIFFVMDEKCHNKFVVLKTKKGEKVVENIKIKKGNFF
jgi:hypothetical protein